MSYGGRPNVRSDFHHIYMGPLHMCRCGSMHTYIYMQVWKQLVAQPMDAADLSSFDDLARQVTLTPTPTLTLTLTPTLALP